MSFQKLIEKSESYWEIFEKGRALGLAEARECQGMIKVIIKLLRLRFGEFDSVNLAVRLQAFDEAGLEKLVAAAGVYADSLEAFQKLLETPQMQPTNI